MKAELVLAAIAAAVFAAPVQGATISLAGTVLNSCVLAIPTPGLMVTDAAGTTLRSDSGLGARAASLTVVAVGATPTLSFSAPQYSGTAGVSPDSVQFSYSAAGSGASRGYSNAAATATSHLIDNFTVNGKIERAGGFPTGTYGMTIDVTCGQ